MDANELLFRQLQLMQFFIYKLEKDAAYLDLFTEYGWTDIVAREKSIRNFLDNIPEGEGKKYDTVSKFDQELDRRIPPYFPPEIEEYSENNPFQIDDSQHPNYYKVKKVKKK